MSRIEINSVTQKQAVRFIGFSAFLITIYFNTQVNDAFNSPKFWILLITSAWLVGFIFKVKPTSLFYRKKIYQTLISILILFVAGLLISVIFSYNKNVALLGETFRRNGALTYLGFVVFLYAAFCFVRDSQIRIFFQFVVLSAVVMSGYSIIQITRHDWNRWTDPNSIISTLGNTNFSGSVMAILAVLIFGFLLNENFNIYQKIALCILLFALFISIYKTNARQAFIILIISFAILITFSVNKKHKKLSYIFGAFIFFFAICALLGTLRMGPFSEFLYKNSVSVRGFYWRAGIQMFKHFPFAGVGIDNYGAFFKEFREVDYPLRYGFGITSSNAHNVFIQNFATGGIVVGIPYLLLQILILIVGLKNLKRAKEGTKGIYLTIFSGWFAYQLQSIISIENVGVGIWGWILGGCVLGLTYVEQDKPDRNPKKKEINRIDVSRIGISSLSVFISILLVIPLYTVDRAVWFNRTYAQSQRENEKQLAVIYADRVLKSSLAVTDYKNVVLSGVFNIEDKKRVIEEIDKISKSDPRNLDTLILLAYCNEQIGNYSAALEARKKISIYDPWNAQNYLGMAQLYRVLGDNANMLISVNKILSFASSDPIAEVARKEFLKTN